MMRAGWNLACTLAFGIALCSCGQTDAIDDEVVDTSLNDAALDRPEPVEGNELAVLADEPPQQVHKPQVRSAPREDDEEEDYYEGDMEDEQLEPTRATAAYPLMGLISGDDYPADAQRNDEQGQVTVQLSIGTDGRVTGCTVVQTSGSRSLDNATCRILRSRSRFVPARSSNGQPMPDTFTQTINWRLQG